MKLFDLKGVKSQAKKDFELMPAGKYNLICTNATLEKSKTGGKYIKAEFTVMDGEFAKRKLWMNFNIENANPKAVEIGLEQLKSLGECAGADTDKMETLSDLLELEVTAMVKITPASGSYSEKNEIHYFIPKEITTKSKSTFSFYDKDLMPF